MPWISWLRMSMFASLWICPHSACACMTHCLDSEHIRSLMFPSNEANKIDMRLVSPSISHCHKIYLIKISPLYKFQSHNRLHSPHITRVSSSHFKKYVSKDQFAKIKIKDQIKDQNKSVEFVVLRTNSRAGSDDNVGICDTSRVSVRLFCVFLL